MTLSRDAPSPAPLRRSELQLAAQQADAIAAFTRAHRTAQQAREAAARSREMKLDNARAMEVLRRQHAALIARAHEHLRLTGTVLRSTCARRVVLAHRNEWFRGKLSRALQDGGLHVVAVLDNGADAVGVTVAEQPDLLLVEDTLAMVPGEAVVREVLRFCPDTVVAAQVAYSDGVGALKDAGAHEVFTRQVPAAEVAERLLVLSAKSGG